ncbi:hypothetical protein LAZ67_1001815 [Cordylochernes scorpioides]|uniref:Uncharacterized protein n=1 Tax=Cordylochernes scorpioides TaxID=51811 RepID=A0ABY6JX47_9ARAC|nr:hypothetical protein LAZ67_1001815 [Cordylochernes scorpioides]
MKSYLEWAYSYQEALSCNTTPSSYNLLHQPQLFTVIALATISLKQLQGIEPNSGPKQTRQTTLDAGKDKDLQDLILALSN